MKYIIFSFIFMQSIQVAVAQGQHTDDNWLESAEMNFRQNDYDSALRDYNNYIDINPNDPVAYLYRARFYEATGRRSESKMDMAVAQQLNPLVMLHFSPELRQQHSAKKSYEYNYNDLEASFVKSPSRYKEYQAIFNELSLAHSQDSLIQIVIQELANKDLDKAEKKLSEIKVNSLNKAVILDLTGKIYLKRMDYQNAINAFSEAIEENPQFSIAYHNRGICYKLIGELDKAEADLKQAINLNDNISLFYFTYAKLNEKQDRNQLAMNNYSKAIELDNDYQEALVNYSQLVKVLGDYDTGLNLIKEAIDKNENVDQNRFFLANLHFVYGDFHQAINEYENFLDSYPNDEEALYNLGLSHILIRESAEGCNLIDQSLRIKDSTKRLEVYNMFCK